MAAVVVAINNVTRVNDADARGTLWTDLGGGTAVDEPDFLYQGTQSVSEKVKTTEGGVKYHDSGTSHALSTNDRTVIFKHIATTSRILNNRGATGGILELGSGNRTNYYRFYVVGGDTYPKSDSWLITPVNPNLVAYRSATVSSPNLATVDFYAWACDFSASPKSENVAMDAIDFVDAGGGLILTGGDGGDADGVFNDFPAFDEDTIGNSYGLATRKAGIHFVFGTLTIGSATATVFTDSGSVLVFPNGFYNAGFSGLAFGLQSASSVLTVTRATIASRGIGARMRFDTETGIDGTNEIVSGSDVADLRNVFPIATAVIARSQGGTETPGLTDGTRYWVGHSTAGSGGITLHTTQANAISGTSPVNLTASSAGNGEIWRLDVDIDTRAEINVTGTSGTLAITGGQISNFADVVLTSGATLTDPILVDLGALTTAGAQLDGVRVLGHPTLEGEPCVVCSDLDDIFDCTFDNTDGRGFAIESTVVANDTLSGVQLVGYGGSTTFTDHDFDATAGGVDTTNDRITMDTGDAFATGDPVYYTRRLTANTIVTGLSEGTVYYVNRFAAGVYTLHLNEGDAINGNAPINLSVVGSGTHSLYSANAAIFFSGGGTQTLSISGGGTTPTYAAVLDSVITISATVTVTFDKLKDNSEVWVFPNGTRGIGNAIAETENATAGSVDNRNFAWSAAAGAHVDYIIHHFEDDGDDFQHIEVIDFVVPNNDTTIDIAQIIDRNST